MNALLSTMLVKPRSWDELPSIVASCGGRLEYVIKSIGWAVVAVETTQASNILHAYLSHPGVEDAEPDQAGRPG